MFRRVQRPGHLRGLIGAVAAATVLAAVAVAQPAVAKDETLTGTIVTVNQGDFTIEQPGKASGRINQMIAYANRLAAKNYPYVYGGGHGRVGDPSTGTSGRKAKGFDCSGAVAAVMAAAGLWPKNSGVPGDVGVINQLLHAKVIAKGAGTPPYAVDLFDRPNDDIQMNIEGDFFGTGYTAKGGPAWMGALAVSFPRYKAYHVLPSVLGDRSSYEQRVTFEYTSGFSGFDLAQQLKKHEKVRVTYRESDGVLIALSATDMSSAPAKTPTG